MDPSVVGTHLGGVVTVAILASLVKPLLEGYFPAGSKLHDTVIRLVAILFGVLGYVGDYLGNAPAATFSGLESALGSGFIAGIGAVLTYHLVTASYFDPGTPTTLLTSTTTTTPLTAGLYAPTKTQETTLVSTAQPPVA